MKGFELLLAIGVFLKLTSCEKGNIPGQFSIKLHRQRVAVQEDDGHQTLKSVYFGSIHVGGPEPQEFSVVFDTGSGHAIVPSVDCTSETCLAHRRFDRLKSDTATDIDWDGTTLKPNQARDQMTVSFGTGEITGQFVHERLCLGSSSREATLLKEDKLEDLTAEGPHHLRGKVEAGSAASTRRTSSSESSPATGVVLLQSSLNLSSLLDAERKDEPCVMLRLVVATEMTQDPFSSFAFDGIIGLGLESLALSPHFSFFAQMVEQGVVAQPIFAVFLGSGSHEESEIRFGGIAEDRMEGPVHWVPVAMPELGHWEVSIRRILVDDQVLDYCNDGSCRAVVDTGTSLLASPVDLADELYLRLTEALQDPEPNPDGTYDCAKAHGSILIFELSDELNITVGSKDYARDWQQDQLAGADAPVGGSEIKNMAVATGMEDLPEQDDLASVVKAMAVQDHHCAPSLMPISLPAPLGPKLFIWGEPILQKYYTAYDWQQLRIGFALAAHE